MGIASAIEWTDATWNPWQGCTKISPACEHCYMFTDMKRYGRDGAIVVRSKPPTFNLPLKQKRTGEHAIAPGSKVFTCSWSDWFHQRADAWRPEAWDIIRRRPDVTFQIVTKRTDRIAQCLPTNWGNGWPNVWLIATVENQVYADRRIPELLSVPAVVHGLSCEPLLGSIDLIMAIGEARRKLGYLNNWNTPTIDWVIAGGESGPGARPMHRDWVRRIRNDCFEAGIAFFFKQWGDWLPEGQNSEVTEYKTIAGATGQVNLDHPRFPGTWSFRVGKKVAGRSLDGAYWNQFPEVAHA